MFISTGIGTSHIPVRFGVPPEISLLTLGSAPTGSPTNR
jgi:predicted MPP superfamily phosphohydrolase